MILKMSSAKYRPFCLGLNVWECIKMFCSNLYLTKLWESCSSYIFCDYHCKYCMSIHTVCFKCYFDRRKKSFDVKTQGTSWVLTFATGATTMFTIVESRKIRRFLIWSCNMYAKNLMQDMLSESICSNDTQTIDIDVITFRPIWCWASSTLRQNKTEAIMTFSKITTFCSRCLISSKFHYFFKVRTISEKAETKNMHDLTAH